MEMANDEEYYVPPKSKVEIIAPRAAFLVLKIMGIIFAIGLLVSDPAFLAPVLLLAVTVITYRTMKIETGK
ncbi:MAG: hypothetical protein H9W81_13815 [Enterococcus sp.]|nr:hypothetical protein [Enterococcus sp.]